MRKKVSSFHIWALLFVTRGEYIQDISEHNPNPRTNPVRLQFPKYKIESSNDTHGDEKGV
jgi:hypothetical protein